MESNRKWKEIEKTKFKIDINLNYYHQSMQLSITISYFELLRMILPLY